MYKIHQTKMGFRIFGSNHKKVTRKVAQNKGSKVIKMQVCGDMYRCMNENKNEKMQIDHHMRVPAIAR